MLPSRFAFAISAETVAIASSVEGFGFFVFAILSLILIQDVYKRQGLNVAADPLFTLSYTGVRGGLVIGVADDAGMHSSQNEQDSRHYAIAAKLPMCEPSDAAESLADV